MKPTNQLNEINQTGSTGLNANERIGGECSINQPAINQMASLRQNIRHLFELIAVG